MKNTIQSLIIGLTVVAIIFIMFFISGKPGSPSQTKKGKVAGTTSSAEVAANQTIRRINPQEAYKLLTEGRNGSKVTIIDIRTPEEYQQGHIEGSINIDKFAPDFQSNIAKLDKKTPYLIYCKTGNRSSQALQTFRSLQFYEVYELEGGYLAWMD